MRVARAAAGLLAILGFGWLVPAAEAQYVPETPSTSATVASFNVQNTGPEVSGASVVRSAPLSRTGTESGSQVAYGAVLIGAGSLTVVAARRRRLSVARR